MLPELLRAPHCPRDAPDHAGRSGGEQLLCSSNRSRAKAWPSRVCMAAVNPSHCREQAAACKREPSLLGSSSAKA